MPDAVEVRVQPDDADWDAGDMRYNVLRWTSSPTPPFGGYGPSFVNPRTGQILGADVMLEYSFLTNRMRYAETFDVATALLADAASAGDDVCTLGAQMQAQAMLGAAALRARGASERDQRMLVEHSVYYLVLHEIGHTLGLNHNMRASQMLTPEQTTDFELTERVGLMGSVMDYPAVNLAAPGESQGVYYSHAARAVRHLGDHLGLR